MASAVHRLVESQFYLEAGVEIRGEEEGRLGVLLVRGGDEALLTEL